MEYIIYDKSEYEMDIITDILEEENIKYRTKRHAKEYASCPVGKAYIMVYDICVNTSYENLNFIKYLADKRIKQKIHLENCYDLLEEEKPVEVEIQSWAKSIVDYIRGN